MVCYDSLVTSKTYLIGQEFGPGLKRLGFLNVSKKHDLRRTLTLTDSVRHSLMVSFRRSFYIFRIIFLLLLFKVVKYQISLNVTIL